MGHLAKTLMLLTILIVLAILASSGKDETPAATQELEATERPMQDKPEKEAKSEIPTVKSNIALRKNL